MYEDEIPVGKAKDLRGQKFGNLTVLYRVKGINTPWKCQCDCGNFRIVPAYKLQHNNIIDCGKCDLNDKMIGQKFGKLLVLLSAERLEKNHKAYLCQCECGNKKIVSGYHLRKGDIQSCGCLVSEDLTNKKFGRLTVIKRAYIGKDKAQYWECLCDCGTTTYVNSANLKRKHTESCGCYRKDQHRQKTALDLTDQRFGKLVALENTWQTEDGPHSSFLWKCKCDCGNIIYVPANELNAHRVYSCGCSNESKGEQLIKNILLKNNIVFKQWVTFDTCKYKNLLPFDFFVNNQYIIEYDGKQHFQAIDFFGGEDTFKLQQIRDNIKTQWCKDNNIPLIRIPYTHFKDICIEDLLLETSKFII